MLLENYVKDWHKIVDICDVEGNINIAFILFTNIDLKSGMHLYSNTLSQYSAEENLTVDKDASLSGYSSSAHWNFVHSDWRESAIFKTLKWNKVWGLTQPFMEDQIL